MGLHLLCTQSSVIIGRTDKKAKKNKNRPDPIGASECLRLVREFTLPVDEPESTGVEFDALYRELEVLRESVAQQSQAQQSLTAEVEAAHQRSSRQPQSNPPAQIIQQEYLSPEKRQKLAALIEEDQLE
jgi:hypothetical protein